MYLSFMKFKCIGTFNKVRQSSFMLRSLLKTKNKKRVCPSNGKSFLQELRPNEKEGRKENEDLLPLKVFQLTLKVGMFS